MRYNNNKRLKRNIFMVLTIDNREFNMPMPLLVDLSVFSLIIFIYFSCCVVVYAVWFAHTPCYGSQKEVRRPSLYWHAPPFHVHRRWRRTGMLEAGQLDVPSLHSLAHSSTLRLSLGYWSPEMRNLVIPCDQNDLCHQASSWHPHSRTHLYLIPTIFFSAVASCL